MIVLQALNRRAEIAERGLDREKSYLTTLASLILFHVFVLVGSLFTDRETLPDYLACENNNNSNNNKEAKKGGCFCRLRLSRSLLDTNRICRSPVWPRLLFSRKNVWNICQCTLVVESAELPFTLRTLEP